MKRLELLNDSLGEKKDVQVLSKAVLSEDKKFMRRHIRDLEETVEDLESSLKARLSSDVPLDKSVLELYSQLDSAQDRLETAEYFMDSYL